MTFKSIILGLLVASSCSIICGAACDWIEPGECASDGGLFGPCDGGEACDTGLLCKGTTQGTVCVPPIELAQSLGTEAEDCANMRSLFGLHCNPWWGTCHMPCATDAHCINGTVCAEDWEICVYPNDAEDIKPPPGETLGPCMGDDMLCLHDTDTCVVSLSVSGNICNRMGKFWLVPCSVEDQACPNGQVCALDEGACVWPN